MMNPVRVAFMASEYPPYVYGGLGTHVEAITAALAAQAVLVDLFVPERGEYQTPPPGVQLRLVPTKAFAGEDGNVGYWVSYSTEAIKLVARLGIAFDVIHCHDWLTAVAGAGLVVRNRAPLVFSVHLPQAEHPNVEMEVLGLAAAVTGIVYSNAMCRELLDRDPTAPSLIVIPNGVDTTRFRPLTVPHNGDPSLLFVGRLVAQKGVDVLLRAFAALLVRLPQARLIIAGDGAQALYLQRLARYFGVMQRVDFIGWQTGEELVRCYGQADVVAIPSRYEPFGLVALEAMSCARPVVASSTGGLAEIIQDGKTGILVPPGDHLRLAQGLVRLLLDERARESAGLAARERAVEYKWSQAASATKVQYEQAMQKKVPTRQELQWAAQNLLMMLPPRSRAITQLVLS